MSYYLALSEGSVNSSYDTDNLEISAAETQPCQVATE